MVEKHSATQQRAPDKGKARDLVSPLPLFTGEAMSQLSSVGGSAASKGQGAGYLDPQAMQKMILVGMGVKVNMWVGVGCERVGSGRGEGGALHLVLPKQSN